MSDMSASPKRIRGHVKEDPVVNALSWAAWFFLASEVVLVFLNFFMTWNWTIYTAWIFLILVFLCWGLVIFLEKQSKRVKKYHREMLSYQSDSQLMILDQPDHSPVNEEGVVWPEGVNWKSPEEEFKEMYDGQLEFEYEYEHSLTDFSTRDSDLYDDQEEREDDVRASSDQGEPETEHTSADPSTEDLSDKEDPVDDASPGQGWSTRGWSHTPGHGIDRVSDDGTGTRIDLRSRETTSIPAIRDSGESDLRKDSGE